MLHNLSNNEQSFINHALYEALKSPVLMRHGAVAVANGKIIEEVRTYRGDGKCFM